MTILTPFPLSQRKQDIIIHWRLFVLCLKVNAEQEGLRANMRFE
jgi:hypothetical protein